MRNRYLVVSLAAVLGVGVGLPIFAQQVALVPDMTYPQGSGAIRAMRLQPKLDGVVSRFEWTQFYGKPLAGGPEFAGTPLPPIPGVVTQIASTTTTTVIQNPVAIGTSPSTASAAGVTSTQPLVGSSSHGTMTGQIGGSTSGTGSGSDIEGKVGPAKTIDPKKDGTQDTNQVPPAIPGQIVPITSSSDLEAQQTPVPQTQTVAPSPIGTEQTAPQAAPISNGFVSWTPGTLNVAAVVANGRDLVVSIDGKGDGRAFGTDPDDYEVRISPTTHTVTVRQVNNQSFTDALGWTKLVKFSAAPSTDPALAGSTVIEASIVDPTGEVLPQKDNDFVSVRLDGVSPNEQTSATQLRALTLIRCESSVGPNGTATSQIGDAPVLNMTGINSSVPGANSSIGLDLSKIPANFTNSTFTIEGVGIAKNSIASLSGTLPLADEKGIVHLSYPSYTAANSPLGEGAIHFGLSNAQGQHYDYFYPYQINNWISIQSPAKILYSTSKTVDMNLKATLVSDIRQRLLGEFDVIVPDGWSVLQGSGKQFVLYNINGVSKRAFTVEIPANAKGAFDIILRCVLPNRTIETPVHVLIQ